MPVRHIERKQTAADQLQTGSHHTFRFDIGASHNLQLTQLCAHHDSKAASSDIGARDKAEAAETLRARQQLQQEAVVDAGTLLQCHANQRVPWQGQLDARP